LRGLLLRPMPLLPSPSTATLFLREMIGFTSDVLVSRYSKSFWPCSLKQHGDILGTFGYHDKTEYKAVEPSQLQDPLSNVDICSRDIPYMKELGLNTIRVYTIDNSKDHSECMKLLDEAGIYLILDVNVCAPFRILVLCMAHF